MTRSGLLGISLIAMGALGTACHAADAPLATRLPPPAAAEAPATTHRATAVFAGGCFWGVQSVFQHIRGVTATRAGYDGGTKDTAEYETVSGGDTGHAESVAVEYDPTQVGYGTLMQIFFSVALDPTQVNRQFPDVGSQYRSALFTRTPEQATAARAYIRQLNAAHVFARPIATQIVPDHGFYPAEEYHQNFAARHPEDSYIATYDAPRIEALKMVYGAQYRDDPILTLAAPGGP
ncbi:peptide methionine sulfoxide reductase [Gluconacetobacter diazotrophicus PA1 5]|uniref:Peptide methionine sulfoxide reductase MsrA n=1 Tax=Gluconacetobacter diazotrophicus (strain ATCC 49037 / DSM 5601 / CCUG 37298 / CIP 103539 / LMG 7603 / PAl5) TaxID=272568 RepID=A9H6Y0_GLUDA|nr:peptide-methionine (S)-S-oxide reductase MsrA [Gluconacetobacter diazotrophicus]ACI52481.1 peptide methionine sulfoxide reductase [Gluconacetobacter diazotrophicus PA1 5]TWB03092.1 peptide-methionine (S)-S-oxide reductase [Gluconacetobacter diazotrophicus]CAP57566.1 putative peptide methionine sulfoxide reductase [Gluconacetobacter diazotrophicus PA1 5]